MSTSSSTVSRKRLFFSVLLAMLVRSATAGPYTLHQNNVGSSFLSNFAWQNITDPTNGRVEYVDKATALQENLTYASDDTFIMRADYTTTLSADGPGRKSNRIMSTARYNTHVAVFDIRHMPQGCATWPAIWETNPNEGTSGGEVDILEGVNDVEPDSVTLHTTGTCTMPSSRNQLGTSLSDNCSSSDTIEDGNNGCAVDAPYTSSYGPTFNNYGGGYYALERTAEYIRVWFWSRNDTGVPSEVSSGSSDINTSEWGTPIAFFPDTDCDFSKEFTSHNIIIDLTFCGNWAGAAFSSAGCSGNCTDYVNNNPSAFENAYWDFAAARIYLPSSNTSSNTNSKTSDAAAKLAVSSSALSPLFGHSFLEQAAMLIAGGLLVLAGGFMPF
ncbi:glycoside hydrolase family 16 protein [Wolfiporia cocos MD-104 SS10]|uniref:Glycoside hydrolase family 16 protein n=1 Tax=Wolfiporia cocos (strain MD-104) TaxID=742152 RepID=A0A2H3JCY1_WOLCO|nr:glycoside hydrolase family 16 protein [Wolfiporia cocos MD-104 SS10]